MIAAISADAVVPGVDNKPDRQRFRVNRADEGLPVKQRFVRPAMLLMIFVGISSDVCDVLGASKSDMEVRRFGSRVTSCRDAETVTIGFVTKEGAAALHALAGFVRLER